MTSQQYRCLLGHIRLWGTQFKGHALQQAMADAGVTDSAEDVISELWKCGWHFDPATERLWFNQDGGDEDEMEGP